MKITELKTRISRSAYGHYTYLLARIVIEDTYGDGNPRRIIMWRANVIAASVNPDDDHRLIFSTPWCRGRDIVLRECVQGMGAFIYGPAFRLPTPAERASHEYEAARAYDEVYGSRRGRMPGHVDDEDEDDPDAAFEMAREHANFGSLEGE